MRNLQPFISREYFDTPAYWQFVEETFDTQIRNDLGKKGDITSQLFFNAQDEASAQIIAKSSGILAGAAEISHYYKDIFHLHFHKQDGEKFQPKEILCEISGPILKILAYERTILNFLTHLSSIATTTTRYIQKLANPKILLCATRKTLQGPLAKKAVLVGGGGTHRLNLNSAILIKDTHLDHFQRNLDQIVAKIAATPTFVEIEVESESEALELTQKLPQKNNFAIMLDNFSLAELQKTIPQIRKLRPDIILEASGGINEANIANYGALDLDLISSGSLTQYPTPVDFSLKIKNLNSLIP